MNRGGERFFHSDDLYNMMAINDGGGKVLERYEYGDYGQPLSTSGLGNPYLFNGRRYDPETGLYYYRTRYLDPLAGRFTTRDTIGTWGDARSCGSLLHDNSLMRIVSDPGSGIIRPGFNNSWGGGPWEQALFMNRGSGGVLGGLWNGCDIGAEAGGGGGGGKMIRYRGGHVMVFDDDCGSGGIVIDAGDGPIPQTREHILLARQVSAPKCKFSDGVYVLKKEEGGRHPPFHNRYRP